MTISNPAKNVRIDGRRTSIRLEPPLWEALREIARAEGMDVDTLVSRVEPYRRNRGRTSVLRAFIVSYLVQRAFNDGDVRHSPYHHALEAL